jgi:trigger factor
VKSTVERLSPTRVRINVEVPFDELKPDFDRAYRKIAQQVRIPGFRPGKAPARILEARLGRGVVLDEVVNAAIPVKYSEAVTTAEEVNPIGRPDIEVTEIADGDHLAFTAEVDVRPEITLPDIDGITVTVDDVEVDEAAVAEELDNLRARFGTLTGVERAAGDDDFVLLDLSATVDGEPVEEATTSGFSYQVGQGGLIDGLDEAVRGLSAGESKTFTSQLVAGEYAGKDAEITAAVTAVKERELPEADDEFAQLASEFDTLDELTDDLRTRLGQVKRMEQVTQARDKVLEAIVDATEVPLPESVVTAEVESRVHDAVHAFDHDDARFTEFLDAQGKSREEFDADVRTEAERNVKTRLVLDALAEQEQVSVNDQELTERIIFQAQQYQMPPEEFVRRIQEAGQLGAVYSDVRRSKALIAAVAAATVTDESGAPVDLSDLIGSADEADESGDDAVDTEGGDGRGVRRRGRGVGRRPGGRGSRYDRGRGAGPARGRPGDLRRVTHRPGTEPCSRQRTTAPCAVGDRAVRVGSQGTGQPAMNTTALITTLITTEGRVK